MLKKVFCDKDRKEPISYEEFSAVGMNKLEYISYIAHCDRLRSAIMLIHYSEYKIRSSNIKKEKEPLERICQICLNELLNLLQQFCDDEMNLIDLAQDNVPVSALALMGLSYNGSYDYYLGICDESPSLLYSDFDRFRVYIEKVLYKLINQEFPVFSMYKEPDINDIPLYLLKIRAEQKHDYETHDYKPVFPTNSGKSADIFTWAEKAERYYEHLRFIEDNESIEDVLALKEALIFNVHEHTLYIFGGNLSCKAKQHTIEATKAIVELPNTNTCKVELDILYCYECKKFFINETSYEIYKEKYKFLPICFAYDSSYGSGKNFKNRAEKSPLMLCGYSVSQRTGMSRETRQGLLAWIMDHNIHGLKKTDIIGHLEFLINTNGNNPNNASAKRQWEDDLNFVHEYGIDNQRSTNIYNIARNNRKIHRNDPS